VSDLSISNVYSRAFSLLQEHGKYLLFSLLLIVLLQGVFGVLGLLLLIPFAVGVAYYFRMVVHGVRNHHFLFHKMQSLDDVFDAILSVLRQLLTIVLWSLLFFVPGVIAWYKYRYVDLIITDVRFDIEGRDALQISDDLTIGWKNQLFLLDLASLGLLVLWYAALLLSMVGLDAMDLAESVLILPVLLVFGVLLLLFVILRQFLHVITYEILAEHRADAVRDIHIERSKLAKEQSDTGEEA
jgi:hypothetical protein